MKTDDLFPGNRERAKGIIIPEIKLVCKRKLVQIIDVPNVGRSNACFLHLLRVVCNAAIHMVHALDQTLAL